MIDQHLDGVKQRELTAGGQHRLIRRIGGAEVAGVAIDNCFAHFGNAGHRGVAREVALNSGDCRVFDVLRGSEMRLAGAKIHQLGSLGAKLGSLSGHGHRGRNFDPADAVGE